MQREDSDDIDVRTVIVDGGQSPIRIDKYLMDKLEHVTRNKIQQGIKAGIVLVNDAEIKSNYKVRPSDKITIVMPATSDDEESIIPEDIPLNIVFEDDDVLVVDKPSGMVVHPGISNRSGTLVNAVAYYLGNSSGPTLPGNPANRPGLVHRIDKYTSGLLVLAKNDFTLSALARQFFDHNIHRRYLALVWGAPDPAEGTIDEFIGRNLKDRTRQQVFPDRDLGKHAITHYQVLEDLYYVSLVACELETGRTHQIRVHMQYAGHPLFNDDRYGGREIRKGTVFTKYKQFVNNNFELLEGQALHAAELGFKHPVSGEEMKFTSDLPNNFSDVLIRWRNYLSNRKEIH